MRAPGYGIAVQQHPVHERHNTDELRVCEGRDQLGRIIRHANVEHTAAPAHRSFDEQL